MAWGVISYIRQKRNIKDVAHVEYFADLSDLTRCKNPTSLHTSMVPKTTCRPSKKLSPMMMTVAPPVVHPSLGLIALMHGVAAYPRQREEQIQHLQ